MHPSWCEGLLEGQPTTSSHRLTNCVIIAIRQQRRQPAMPELREEGNGRRLVLRSLCLPLNNNDVVVVVPQLVSETGGILLVSKRPDVHSVQLPRLEHVRPEAVTVQQLDQYVRILSQPECSDLDVIHDRWRHNGPSRHLRRHGR